MTEVAYIIVLLDRAAIEYVFFRFVKVYFIDYAITVVPFFSLLCPATPSHQHSPHPLAHVHGSYIQVIWPFHFLYYS